MEPSKQEIRGWIEASSNEMVMPSNQPRFRQLRRSHLRVRPERKKARFQTKDPVDRYRTLELIPEGFKKPRRFEAGHAMAPYYRRKAPGLWNEERPKVVRLPRVKTSNPVKKKGSRKRIKKVEAAKRNPELLFRELLLSDDALTVYVQAVEYEVGKFAVYCDELPSHPKERPFYTKDVQKAMSCYTKWVEQARHDWNIR